MSIFTASIVGGHGLWLLIEYDENKMEEGRPPLGRGRAGAFFFPLLWGGGCGAVDSDGRE